MPQIPPLVSKHSSGVKRPMLQIQRSRRTYRPMLPLLRLQRMRRTSSSRRWGSMPTTIRRLPMRLTPTTLCMPLRRGCSNQPTIRRPLPLLRHNRRQCYKQPRIRRLRHSRRLTTSSLLRRSISPLRPSRPPPLINRDSLASPSTMRQRQE